MSSESTKTVFSLWQTLKYLKPGITCSFKILSLSVNVTDSFKQFSDEKIFIVSPILIPSFRISWYRNASVKIAQSSKLCVQLYCLLCSPFFVSLLPTLLSHLLFQVQMELFLHYFKALHGSPPTSRPNTFIWLLRPFSGSCLCLYLHLARSPNHSFRLPSHTCSSDFSERADGGFGKDDKGI